MILYLDTSSIVKLYIEEAGTDAVRRWAGEAEVLATCRIAYPELISALNRRLRGGDISRKEFRILIDGFSKEWTDFAIIDFDEIEAGRLSEKYGLRGFDAIHLSALKLLKDRDNHISLAFSSFDKELNRAAASDGFTVLTQ
ncbi:MAG TPA: type II toxin-antitoxin system VapC family toxin [Candidatus Brocadiales bacterium]|nr:type II toxin-antitoxin system VapC family toxin [Candidatus Brocadiales bacterium]